MITATSKNEKYLTEVTNNRTKICCDTSEKSAAGGECMSPHELLCAALASCLNMTARMVLEHKNIAYEGVVTNVELDRSAEGKTKFIYSIDIKGDIPEEVKSRVKEIVKKSPVKKTLSNEIVFETAE